MTHISLMKVRRAARKGVAVGLSATTTLWLVGGSLFIGAPVAHALGNEAYTSDVTGSTPRIAADGEAERVFLGLNVFRSDTTNTVQLNALQIDLAPVDTSLTGDEREATAANVEYVKVVQDASAAGTNGVYDNQDGALDPDGAVTTFTDKVPRTCVAAAAAGTDCDGSSAVIAPALVAGNTWVDLTAAGAALFDATSTVKIGTGATAEIRTATASTTVDAAAGDGCVGAAGTNDCLAIPAVTYAHAVAEVVREINSVIADEAGNGFRAHASNETEVEWGDPGNTTKANNSGYDVPKTDTGTEQGDDLFVVLSTAGGVADAQVKAKIFGAGSVEYLEETSATAVVTTVTAFDGANTPEDGTSQPVTFGADATEPDISAAQSVDNDNDGRVDRFLVIFNESMASTEADLDNFTNAASGGVALRVEVGGTDMTIEATGVWKTTTVLNDTLEMDITNQSAYTNFALSTGDTYTLIYDKDLTVQDLKDATGNDLEDKSKTSVDKALPVVDPTDITNSATLHDLDGDGQVDQLRVTASESLGAASTKDGFVLTNTTAEPDKVMALGGVAGFMKSSGASANDNDTIKITITEAGTNDVNDTFTLAYTAPGTGGVVDVAGNKAPTDSVISNAKGVTPVVEKIEIRDTGNNGKIDRVDVFFSCTLTEVGSAEAEFSVSGYVIASAAPSGKEFQLTLTEGATNDTGATPDVTHTDDGEIAVDGLHCGDTLFPLQVISSGTAIEVDKSQPKLVSATLYEATNDNIWKTGETLQLLYSESVDPAQVATSWDVTSGDGSAFLDWRIESANATNSADGRIPDKGTVTVSGKVVILTATVDGTSALSTGDKITHEPNEVKDAAGNSGFPEYDATAYTDDSVALVVDPTSAPTVDKIATWDVNGNGILDAVSVHFSGLVDKATLASADFAAARGANFTIADAATEAATSTAAVVPDLTLTSVTTVSGGNDSVVLLNFAEANEGTGLHPQAKYVQGGLKDLAANKVATFNANSSDNTKFETTVTTSSQDEAKPVVKHKRLKDRNANGKYDQLLLVFSEGIDNDATATNALANGTHNSTGWTVSNHNIASSGDLKDNTGAYDAYTFATTNAVFQVDILEGSTVPTSVPTASYVSQGNFKDKWQNTVLANVAAGGEMSDLALLPAPSLVVDGDLVQCDSCANGYQVYIAKVVGSQMFRRHLIDIHVVQAYGHLSAGYPGNVKHVTSLDGWTLSAWVRVNVGDVKVYEVNLDHTKHWITCADDAVAGQDCANEWTVAGGVPAGIYVMNAAEAAHYTTSTNVVLPDQPN